MERELCGIPFGGLGHDLTLLVEHALLLSPRRVKSPDVTPRQESRHGHTRAGYALLLALGREIRGR